MTMKYRHLKYVQFTMFDFLNIISDCEMGIKVPKKAQDYVVSESVTYISL